MEIVHTQLTVGARFDYSMLLLTRVAESEVKYPTQTFPKFPTPIPQHEGNEI